MTYWHWPTSFGYVVIDDEHAAEEEQDALVGRRKQEFKNEYGSYKVLKLYCYKCRGFGCNHILSIKEENV